MKLRIQPWLTDSSVTFINNLFKWYPDITKNKVHVLEWGSGNSTLYFLGKNCKVLTIENNEEYIENITSISKTIGYKTYIALDTLDALENINNFDLVILKASSFESVGEKILDFEWSFIVNDGISRTELNEKIIAKNSTAIIILDNVEYCANWGSLARCSAHPERVKSFRKIIRNSDWKHYLFEQPEGREGHSVADTTGWEAPNRWISGILWSKDHILNALMVSNIGFPIVTQDAINDDDILTLSQRCQYDWSKMRWVHENYDNVFDFKRSYY